ncbi:MAG: class III signal peptide-containing protein [Candidatus Norongarragalinales archaeon]
MKKGQGMFEYILLLAGVLLVVVLAIALLRGGLFQSTSSNVERSTCTNELVTAPKCFTGDGAWNATGYHQFSANSNCPVVLGAASPYNCGAAINDPAPDSQTCNCGNDPRTG